MTALRPPPSGERTPCAVPFCRRSLKGLWAWWLCVDHRRLVPIWAKARHRRLKAYFRRRGEIQQDARAWWTTSVRARRAMDAAGREMIRAACRRATGL